MKAHLKIEVIDILLAIAGITGIGKSYYKDKIMNVLGFDKIKIITTRKPRIGEVNNDDKIFVNEKELNELVKSGKIAYKFDLLGNTYAYNKESLFSDVNTVFELHYSTIGDLKTICPKLKVIYLLPKDINMAKEKLRERHLDFEVEQARIKEIDEHYNKIMNDSKLMGMFDYVLYNNYDKESENQVINLVRNLVEKGE
ncbi:MAG: hypothetical protein ACI4VN_04165 [Clostridia bacterium]